MTSRDVDLVKNNLNNNHLHTDKIYLYDKNIFLPSVDKNINILLHTQKLQQLRIKLCMFQYYSNFVLC